MKAPPEELEKIVAECAALRTLLQRSLQLPRPWMDGGITWNEWDELFSTIEKAVGHKEGFEWQTPQRKSFTKQAIQAFNLLELVRERIADCPHCFDVLPPEEKIP